MDNSLVDITASLDRRFELGGYASAINEAHENARYLPGAKLPDSLTATSKLADVGDLDHIASCPECTAVVETHEEVAAAVAPVGVKMSRVSAGLVP